MTTSNNVTAYINFFRQLAIAHQGILHNPNSETQSDAPVGSKHFTKVSVDEVLTGLRTSVGWPCLMLELYETDTNAEIVYDIRKRPKGAFMVLVHPADQSIAEEENCYAVAESIVYDLLKQIWQVHYGVGMYGCTTPFKEFNFDKINITPVGPLFDREFGYRVEFDFEFQQDIDLAVAPAEGVFVFIDTVLIDIDQGALEGNDDSEILLQ